MIKKEKKTRERNKLDQLFIVIIQLYHDSPNLTIDHFKNKTKKRLPCRKETKKEKRK